MTVPISTPRKTYRMLIGSSATANPCAIPSRMPTSAVHQPGHDAVREPDAEDGVEQQADPARAGECQPERPPPRRATEHPQPQQQHQERREQETDHLEC